MTEYMKMIAEHIKSLGFRVFVTLRNDSNYGFFSDGKGIGYFEAKRYYGTYLGTHTAAGSSCSGYEVTRDLGVDEITPELLTECFRKYPSWVKPRDMVRVYQYRDLDEFLQNYWDKNNLEEV